jgi:hypothetical protein
MHKRPKNADSNTAEFEPAALQLLQPISATGSPPPCQDSLPEEDDDYLVSICESAFLAHLALAFTAA